MNRRNAETKWRKLPHRMSTPSLVHMRQAASAEHTKEQPRLERL